MMKNTLTICAAIAAFVCTAAPDDIATEAYAHYEATNECAKTSASLTSLIVDRHNQAKAYADTKSAAALASANEYADGRLVAAKEYSDIKIAAVKEDIEAGGYLTPSATNGLAKVSYVDAKTDGMATTAWVEGLGYVTTPALLGMGYASTNDVRALLTPYATKTYVVGLGYLTEDEMKAWVNGQVFAKESWVTDNMSVMGGEVRRWVFDQNYADKDWVANYHNTHGGGGGSEPTLTPIYSDTPTFSKWITNDDTYFTNIVWNAVDGDWYVYTTGVVVFSPEYGGEDYYATSISDSDENFTATRTRTDIIGYTLGSQTDKALASTNYVLSVKQTIPNNITRTATDATLVHCDNGTCTNAILYIRQASHSLAGLMTAADKTSLDTMKTTVQTVAEDDAQTRQIVATWENFLDGSNVVFSITNYLSGTYNLDAAKMTIKELRDSEYREVYNSRDEILLHIDDFSNRYVRVAIDAIAEEVASRLASKADKDWGKYTSAGGEAPSNTVYMTAPNTVFAGGLEYERVAVGQGSICVLTTRGAPVWAQGDEGTFKFQDDGGTNYFGFAKTDSYVIGANTDGITVNGGMVTMNYNITMSGRPCVWYKSDLSPSVEWEQLNLPDGSPVAGASHTVAWEQNPDPGTQVCYVNVGSQPQGFFRATVEVAGEAKFMTNMPADLSSGIICTNTTTGVNGVIKPAFNGSAVQWTWSAK